MKLLNILIISLLTLMCVTILNAKVYTWTDENGVQHYSDQPPENGEDYEVQTEPPTSQPVEEADKKRTESEQKQIQDLTREADEILEKQQSEAKLKAEEAEKNRPPTQEEFIAAEKEKLEKKIAELEGLPLKYFGNEKNKHRHIAYYHIRLETLLQDPDQYYKIPKSYEEYINQPD